MIKNDAAPDGTLPSQVFDKPVALVALVHEQRLSVHKRRLVNEVLLRAAEETQAPEGVVSARTTPLRKGCSFASNEVQRFRTLCQELESVEAWTNALAGDEPERRQQLFKAVRFQRGMVQFTVNPEVRALLLGAGPTVKIDLTVERRLHSPTAIALYELCMIWLADGASPMLSRDHWRRLLLDPNSRTRNGDFISSVIKPAMGALEAEAGLHLEIDNAAARPIQSFRLRIRQGQADNAAFASGSLLSAEHDRSGDSLALETPARTGDKEADLGRFQDMLDQWNEKARQMAQASPDTSDRGEHPAFNGVADRLRRHAKECLHLERAVARGQRALMADQQMLEAARTRERREAIVAVQALVVRYGLSIEEVFRKKGAACRTEELESRTH